VIVTKNQLILATHAHDFIGWNYVAARPDHSILIALFLLLFFVDQNAAQKP
jgi:hypothetical protein